MTQQMDTEDWADVDGTGVETTIDLTAFGPQVRPNGTTYIPRFIGKYEDIAWMRYLREHREHVLFYGPPGTGKSALSEASFPQMQAVNAAGEREVDADGNPVLVPGFETLIGTADTVESDFVGTYVPDPASPIGATWVDGPFIRSLKRGVPLLVEEIALIDPRVTSVLYAAMDGRSYVEVPSNPSLGRIPVPESGWIVVGSYNPDVPGASMSDALVSRFNHNVEITTDWDLAATLGVDARMIAVAQTMDERRRRGSLSWSPQLRELLAFKSAQAVFGAQYALSNLLSQAPVNAKQVLASIIEESFQGMGLAPNGKDVKVLALGKQFR